VFVFFGVRWQEQHDLSERLLVYRSVDSQVEFQIPLRDKPDGAKLADATTDGFLYRGLYYGVVSAEVRGDTLYLSGLETDSPSFWQGDLLSFLNNHLTQPNDANRKAGQWLKLLLKDYLLTSRLVLRFDPSDWRDAVGIPQHAFAVPRRALPVHVPPPRV